MRDHSHLPSWCCICCKMSRIWVCKFIGSSICGKLGWMDHISWLNIIKTYLIRFTWKICLILDRFYMQLTFWKLISSSIRHNFEEPKHNFHLSGMPVTWTGRVPDEEPRERQARVALAADCKFPISGNYRNISIPDMFDTATSSGTASQLWTLASSD